MPLDPSRHNTISRRTFLKGAAAGGVALAGGALWTTAIHPRRVHAVETPIRHVIVAVQENRSFDHYFGTLRGVRGFGDPRAVRLPSGDPVWRQPNGAGAVLPFHPTAPGLGAQFLEDLPHFLRQVLERERLLQQLRLRVADDDLVLDAFDVERVDAVAAIPAARSFAIRLMSFTGTGLVSGKWTVTFRSSKPLPLVRGSGSPSAATKRPMPAAIIKSEQAGPRALSCAHGSSVT